MGPGELNFRDKSTGSCKSVTSKQTSLTALPSTWQMGGRSSTCPISAYAAGAATQTTNAPGIAPPANTDLPRIVGTAVQGQVLTTSNGSWSNSPLLFTDQWQDCDSSGNSCNSILGAITSSYTLTSSDVGHMVRVVVTAANAGGVASTNSAPTAVVTVPAPPAPTAAFGFSPSSPQPGQSVSFDGSASTCGAPPGSYTWEDDPPGGGTYPLGTDR